MVSFANGVNAKNTILKCHPSAECVDIYEIQQPHIFDKTFAILLPQLFNESLSQNMEHVGGEDASCNNRKKRTNLLENSASELLIYCDYATN